MKYHGYQDIGCRMNFTFSTTKWEFLIFKFDTGCFINFPFFA